MHIFRTYHTKQKSMEALQTVYSEQIISTWSPLCHCDCNLNLHHHKNFKSLINRRLWLPHVLSKQKVYRNNPHTLWGHCRSKSGNLFFKSQNTNFVWNVPGFWRTPYTAATVI